MACNNSTLVYWAGDDFSTAPQLYSNSTLTTVVPDGLYQFGGVYRIMSGGVLTPAIKCPSCLFDCSSASIISGGGGTGNYVMNINVGATTGAIIVRFNPFSAPSRLIWTYDGLTASEYSSATLGYKEGLIGQYSSSASGGSYTCGSFTVNSRNGSNSQVIGGFEYVYDFIGNTFLIEEDINGNTVPATIGPYNSNEVDLFSAVPGYFTAVIPKPNATPSTLKLEVEAICPNTLFNIDVNCPVSLNSFTAGVVSGGCGVYSTNIFTASVATTTGVSSAIAVNDWAFSDVNGVTQLPAGIYPVQIGGVNNFVTVDSNGIVTAVATCP